MDMLKFEIEYDFGKTTTARGTERIKVSGTPNYYYVKYVKKEPGKTRNITDKVDEIDLKNKVEKKHRGPSTPEEFWEEVQMLEKEHPSENELEKPKSYFITNNRSLAKLRFSDIKEKIETKPDPNALIENSNGELTAIMEFDGELDGYFSEGDELEWVEEYNLGVEMSKFLNFDIDNFIQGEAEFTFPTDEEQFDSHIQNIVLYQNHDISNPLNRNKVWSYLYNGVQNMNEFLNLPMPVFIRMFWGYFIDWKNWEYNAKGIEHIKKLQEKYRGYCDKFFILEEGDERRPIEVFCDWQGYRRESNADINKARRLLRSYIKQAQEYTKKYMNGEDCEYDPMEQALLGELYAMLCKDNVHLKKCSVCGRYYVGNKNSSACNHYYFEEKNAGIPKIQEQGYRVSIESAFGDRKNHHIMVSDCSEIERSKRYNQKLRYNEIATISADIKTRMATWLYDNGNKVYNQLDEVHAELGDDVKELLENTIKVRQVEYLEKYEAAKSQKAKEEIAFEYYQMLVDTVNKEIEKYSPQIVKELNFSKKKGKYRVKK